MQKYFINEQEVDEGEFNAEFTAQLRAFVDQNFEEILIDYSNNLFGVFSVGHLNFRVMDIFDMLTIEEQTEIEEVIYEYSLEKYGSEFDYHGEVSFVVNGVEFEFTTEYVEDEE